MSPFLRTLYQLRIPVCCGRILLAVVLSSAGQAAVLESSDGASQDHFGWSVGLSGNVGLVGAVWEDGASTGQFAERGAAYLFRNLDTATGPVTQAVKLVASDAANRDELGTSVSLFGNIALLGAPYDNAPTSDQGSVYLYRNLDTATGTITQNAKLIASDAAASSYFGTAVSLYGTTALVGATGTTVGANDQQGAVYLFRNLDSATGTVTENAKLIASDGQSYSSYGGYVSLSGNMGIVCAYNSGGGSYLYRNLDTATGTITESAKFQTSDGTELIGPASIDGTNAVVVGGANAYYYRHLDVTTPLAEVARLSLTDPTTYGPTSVALSGSVAIIGDAYQDVFDVDSGAAYLYVGLNTLTGSTTESVKIFQSHGLYGDLFGKSVALEGDTFIVGADFAANSHGTYSGAAYSGSVSSLTTLDEGNTSRNISGISFVSRQDWIIGEHTSHNTVTLGEGDTANVTAAGKTVYVGRYAGANDNVLAINGHLQANEVYIGSTDGNTGNILQLENTSTFTATAFRLANENILSIEGTYMDFTALLLYLGNTELQVWREGFWETVDANNYASLIFWNYRAGYTDIQAIPEPSTWLLVLVGLALLKWPHRHRGKASQRG